MIFAASFCMHANQKTLTNLEKLPAGRWSALRKDPPQGTRRRKKEYAHGEQACGGHHHEQHRRAVSALTGAQDERDPSPTQTSVRDDRKGRAAVENHQQHVDDNAESGYTEVKPFDSGDGEGSDAGKSPR